MWILVSRPLVILMGFAGLGITGFIGRMLSQGHFAADLVTDFGWLLIAAQAVVCLGLIVGGIWAPLHRAAEDRHGHSSN